MSKSIIYQLDYVVENCFIGLSHRNLIIKGIIYEISIKIFNFEIIRFYKKQIFTPYIKDPFYDGEYATNTLLKSYTIQLNGALEDKLNIIKQEINHAKT